MSDQPALRGTIQLPLERLAEMLSLPEGVEMPVAHVDYRCRLLNLELVGPVPGGEPSVEGVPSPAVGGLSYWFPDGEGAHLVTMEDGEGHVWHRWEWR